MGTRDFRFTQSNGDWSHLDSNHRGFNGGPDYPKTVRVSSCLVILGVHVGTVLEQFFYRGRLARVGSCVQRRVASIVSDVWWCVAVLKKKPDQREPYKACFLNWRIAAVQGTSSCMLLLPLLRSAQRRRRSHRTGIFFIQCCRIPMLSNSRIFASTGLQNVRQAGD